jgi:hypothetical protein
MITGRRMAATMLGVVVLVLAAPDQPQVNAALIAVALASAASAMWSARRGECAPRDRPGPAPDPWLADVVWARVGEPIHAVAAFVLRVQHAPQERWYGHEALWMAVSDTSIWLLHTTADGSIGGVKSRFSRTGVHTRWAHHPANCSHAGELSWPADPWFIAGELYGPQDQRLRLIGLLAADELGVRQLLTDNQPQPER